MRSKTIPDPFLPSRAAPHDQSDVANPTKPSSSSPSGPVGSAAPPGKAKRTPEQEKVWQAAMRQAADTIELAAAPLCLTHIFGEGSLPLDGAREYLNRVLAGSGKPKDPIERMMIEQLTLAHHRIISLHSSAREASTNEGMKIHTNAGVQLMSEFRRTALALKAYRQPPSRKEFSVVHQQNVVTSGQQHVRYTTESSGKETLVVRDELKDNFIDPLERRISGDREFEESQTGGSREAKRSLEAPLVG